MSDLTAIRDATTTTLTLDRDARRNSLSRDLVEELIVEVRRAVDEGSRLLVVRGNGRSFSAGFDFSGYESSSEADLLHRFVRIETLLQTVARAPLTTLALVHGPTFGAGADLAVACDYRVLEPSATLRMPGYRFGLALGTRRLARLIGPDPARRVLQEARTIDASSAAVLGLATAVEAREGWDAVVADTVLTATALTAPAQSQLRACTTDDTGDRDLADLVRSAAEPGLRERIAEFREESR